MFQEYPKTLVHPDYEPVESANDYAMGKAAPFAPIIVKNSIEETAAKAKGYVAAGDVATDTSSFARMTAAPKPEGYEVKTWPRWVDGKIVEGPERKAEIAAQKRAAEYPQWVDGRIVDGPVREEGDDVDVEEKTPLKQGK